MEEKDIEVNLDENEEKNKEANENSPKNCEGETSAETEKKERHKKKHGEENEKLLKLSKEEIIKEYDRVLNENEKLKISLVEKEKESIEYLDRYRRTLADMENLRKRVTAEKQDSLKYANFNIVSDLLTILDDFERAIESANCGSVEFDSYKTGIEMIEKQFADLLFKKYGVSKFGEKGEEFDPNLHSAMLMEEGDFKSEEITEVFRKGYSLHDRVVRAAQVKIGKPKA